MGNLLKRKKNISIKTKFIISGLLLGLASFYLQWHGIYMDFQISITSIFI